MNFITDSKLQACLLKHNKRLQKQDYITDLKFKTIIIVYCKHCLHVKRHKLTSRHAALYLGNQNFSRYRTQIEHLRSLLADINVIVTHVSWTWYLYWKRIDLDHEQTLCIIAKWGETRITHWMSMILVCRILCEAVCFGLFV